MRNIIMECTGLSPAQLHAAFKEALQFPHWYGGNLDALYDCLEDLEEETHLVLKNLQHAAFIETVRDVHNPRLTVEFL